jgi:hypothetical protein
MQHVAPDLAEVRVEWVVHKVILLRRKDNKLTAQE